MLAVFEHQLHVNQSKLDDLMSDLPVIFACDTVPLLNQTDIYTPMHLGMLLCRDCQMRDKGLQQVEEHWSRWPLLLGLLEAGSQVSCILEPGSREDHFPRLAVACLPL